eukprot:CAMPEP_0171933676 /NCGR_PEP_ID=MMETSP0993-20121228/31424_1 /TAXON_ID=483369 /ORGANISM="non described non described, Strain CCMP2098" /LENGTH=249 /DNA_ID=CAMNT_0012574235 /DNA_START=362 /DNA_END=1111 /DNA_ORIENTATION=+
MIMVREPSARFVAAVNQGLEYRCDGATGEQHCPTKKEIAEQASNVLQAAKVVCSAGPIPKSIGTLLSKATIKPLLGCQTKMLLGRPCAHSAPLTYADVQRAVGIVQDHKKVVFAGDTDLWDLSVCAYWARVVSASGEGGMARCPPSPLLARADAMHGPKDTFPIDMNQRRIFETLSLRRNASARGEKVQCDDKAAAVAAVSHDAADEALFLAMRKRLLALVKEFKSEINACEVCPNVTSNVGFLGATTD